MTVRRVGMRASSVVFAAAAAISLAGAPAAEETHRDGARDVPRLSRADEQLLELGRRLFFETGLSLRGERACASCHDPEHGFSDPARRSRDDVGRTRRHSQALIDVALDAEQHWDGEFESFAALVRARVTGEGGRSDLGYGTGRARGRLPRVLAGFLEGEELALPSATLDLGPNVDTVAGRPGGLAETVADGAQRVANGRRYREALARVGQAARLDLDLATRALTDYVASLRSQRSAFDRHQAGDAEALSAAAKRGLELFLGPGRCSQCHLVDGQDGWPAFRDGAFHNTGVAWQAEPSVLASTLVLDGKTFELDMHLMDRGQAGVQSGHGALRAFKTATLRDVARHPPYFHDGSRSSLEEVVRHYAGGCGDDPERDPRLKGFPATDEQVHDLVAFLEALTSEVRPGLAVEPWSARAGRTRLTFLDASSRPVTGLEVRLEPAGDVVPGALDLPLPRLLVTDAKGEIAYAVPARTHVRLRLPLDLVPRGGDLVPDTCAQAEVRLPALGRGRVALVLESPRLRAPHRLRAYVPTGGASRARLVPTAQEPLTVLDEPWPLELLGVVAAGNRRVAVYEGWMLTPRETQPMFVRLPGQGAPQAIRLEDQETPRFSILP